MGLDLIVLPKAKPGHESLHLRLVKKIQKEQTITDHEAEQFKLSTIPSYATLGAPQVGQSQEADNWIIASQREAGDQRSDSSILEDLKGLYVLRLLKNCDGIPEFSNGGLYEGVDETSFRGAFLDQSSSLIDDKTLDIAWTHVMTPQEAIKYGKCLLRLAESDPQEQKKSGNLFSRIFARQREVSPIEEQREILRGAGKWYIFWGERDHHIQAYF